MIPLSVTATNPISDTLKYLISNKHHNATYVISDKHHKAAYVISDKQHKATYVISDKHYKPLYVINVIILFFFINTVCSNVFILL